ncbi:MAG: PilZ domain-containing protein [Candidatus Omnitrophica bacterium]|nr:PilZ domain-containing protein [Candidatus Omnitrophota bacterium]
MTEALEERRIFERVSAKFPTKIKDSRNDYGTEVFLRDVCAGGARLLAKERVFVNDSLALQVQIPDGQSPIMLNGYVVWARPHDMMWEIGMTFHKIDLLKLHRIIRLTFQDF